MANLYIKTRKTACITIGLHHVHDPTPQYVIHRLAMQQTWCRRVDNSHTVDVMLWLSACGKCDAKSVHNGMDTGWKASSGERRTQHSCRGRAITAMV